MRRLVALAAISVLALALPAPVPASESMPSGRILSGAGETPASPEVDYGCAGAVDCRIWLESGCSPDHAGDDPALHASIVKVAHLAGAATPRKVGTSPWIPLRIQFWSADCTEIPKSRWTTWDCRVDRRHCFFRIPASALWMTVSARADNVDTDWALE